MCDKGLWKAYHLDVQRIADKYQKYILEQLWGFPSNQMPLRTTLLDISEGANIHYVI